MAENKTRAQKFAYISIYKNKHVKTKIKNTIPFVLTQRKGNTQVYTLKNHEQYLFPENYTVLMKEIRKYLHKWGDISHP